MAERTTQKLLARMMWKGPKEFFTYNKKQRNGLLVLIAVLVVIQLVLYFEHYRPAPNEGDTSQLHSIISEWEEAKDSLGNFGSTLEIEYFTFDPNTATANQFEALGLPPYLASRIVKYRRKGGRFSKKEDLLSIYDMDSTWYYNVAPYITIESQSEVERFSSSTRKLNLKPFEINTVTQTELESFNIKEWQAKRIITFREKVHPFKAKEELYKVYGFDSAFVKELLPFVMIDEVEEEDDSPTEIIMVELNRADSLQLLSIKGIGPTFSKRILEHREKLGGFYSKEQLLEVYGMDAERLAQIDEWITIDENQIRKLNVNEATFKELLRHPYIEYNMVKSIVNFREQVRPFKNVGELKNLEFFNQKKVERLKPYLKVE